MIEGIDVSWWQEEMDWQKAQEAGTKFAFIRAGSCNSVTGACYTDYQFHRNAEMAPDYMPVGYYWYFRPKHNPEGQAEYFVDLIRDKERPLHAVCDIEVKGYASAVKQFCEMVSTSLGKRIIIYTGPNAWIHYLIGDKSWAKDYPLWIANYETLWPYIPEPWSDYLAWQYAIKSDGRMYGAGSIGLDHNIAHDALIGKEDPPEPPPPPEPSDELVVGCSWLNFRTSPDSNVDNRMAVNRYGMKVTDLHEDVGVFKKVKVEYEAYASGRFLEEK